jgi:hypothetical protein
MQQLSGFSAPVRVLRKPLLVIDVQHGLCNRLRALASAAVIAEATGRQLVMVWRTDAHCGARAGDLLHLGVPVIEDDAADLLRERAARVYNYMEVEPGAQFGAPVLAEGSADIYVRSAYVLASAQADPRAETRFLRGLRPSGPVLDLVRSQADPFDLALHIRMATGPGFDHLPQESPENWPEERHRELAAWRQASHVRHFLDRLEALEAEGRAGRIFAAADLAATYEALSERFGARVHRLERDLYDRSPRQMQYALADLILLTRAPLFLASTGSSFSDMAQRLARPGRKQERSGTDF